ncbi:868_t:CDS:2 [Entrophospora sp. SA101]|nr:9642_t:CDS:2 [Entrophospora sp. SA101]CAJ0649724.1 868_t:CDS:2 [Entrophospora sp. SA101]CAJ0908148.1 11070_t:CDS:2 [Entrophospora sp. SA101]CAJ0918044.1 7891_t:CDS:2 [Entrophospora sp. SA101]
METLSKENSNQSIITNGGNDNDKSADGMDSNMSRPISMEYEHKDSESDDGAFALRPSFKQKFRAPVAKQIIQSVVQERLNNALYNKDQAPGWAHEISQEIKKRLLEMDLRKYKYVINVIIMENKKEGARVEMGCVWDTDTDNVAFETFRNDDSHGLSNSRSCKDSTKYPEYSGWKSATR